VRIRAGIRGGGSSQKRIQHRQDCKGEWVLMIAELLVGAVAGFAEHKLLWPRIAKFSTTGTQFVSSHAVGVATLIFPFTLVFHAKLRRLFPVNDSEDSTDRLFKDLARVSISMLLAAVSTGAGTALGHMLEGDGR